MTGDTPAVHEALAVYAPETTETDRVPEGYKQTEVGAIPEDWAVVTLQDVCTFYNGRAYQLTEWESSGTPVIRLQNLTGGNHYYYSTLKLPAHQYCEYGDLLYMWSATFGPHIWRGEEAIYHYHIWKVEACEGEGDKLFLYYKLDEITQDKKTRASNGGTMLHVTKESMEKALISAPPFHEQRAIAAALSDVDALISALDELIAKKRAVKTAAMQQLLTGKQRLPVFSGEWEVKRLGDVGTFSKGSGLAKSDLSPSGKLPAIPYTAIYTDLDEVIEFSKLVNFTNPSSGARIINSPHLLIAGSSNMLENIGKVTAFKEHTETVIGGDIILYKTSDDVSFLSYLLNTRLHRELIISLSQGSTIRHVYAATFRDYEVSLPPVEEQTAIAAVLSDMDAEIEALEARREKTRQVKRGMMQELLTGRTRLV